MFTHTNTCRLLPAKPDPLGLPARRHSKHTTTSTAADIEGAAPADRDLVSHY